MKRFIFGAAVLGLVLAGCNNVNTSTSTGGLSVTDVKLSAAKRGPEQPGNKFQPGQTVWIGFTITGFKQGDDGNIWVQEDASVDGPDGKSVFKKDNLLEVHEKADKGTNQLTVDNNLDIPATFKNGDYKVHLTVRDKVGNGTANNNFSFTEAGAPAVGGSPSAAPSSAAASPSGSPSAEASASPVESGSPEASESASPSGE